MAQHFQLPALRKQRRQADDRKLLPLGPQKVQQNSHQDHYRCFLCDIRAVKEAFKQLAAQPACSSDRPQQSKEEEMNQDRCPNPGYSDNRFPYSSVGNPIHDFFNQHDVETGVEIGKQDIVVPEDAHDISGTQVGDRGKQSDPHGGNIQSQEKFGPTPGVMDAFRKHIEEERQCDSPQIFQFHGEQGNKGNLVAIGNKTAHRHEQCADKLDLGGCEPSLLFLHINSERLTEICRWPKDKCISVHKRSSRPVTN